MRVSPTRRCPRSSRATERLVQRACPGRTELREGREADHSTVPGTASIVSFAQVVVHVRRLVRRVVSSFRRGSRFCRERRDIDARPLTSSLARSRARCSAADSSSRGRGGATSGAGRPAPWRDEPRELRPHGNARTVINALASKTRSSRTGARRASCPPLAWTRSPSLHPPTRGASLEKGAS